MPLISPPPTVFAETRPALVALDVDGVLTDNAILLTGTGEELKPFHVPDGAGLRWLQRLGVIVAWVSGRPSEPTQRRAEELGVEHCETGVRDKGAALAQLLDTTGVPAARAVYVGDDLIDLPAFAEVGLPVAVADAHPAVRARAAATTSLPGGRGAVREVCEWIIEVRGEWSAILGRVDRRAEGRAGDRSPQR